MVFLDGAADGVGGAHVLQQVARDRRLGRHLGGQRIEHADAGRDAVELGLGGIPLVHQHRVAGRGAGLQARRDGVHQAAIGLRLAGDLPARRAELALLLGNGVGKGRLVGPQLLDALADGLGAGLADGGIGGYGPLATHGREGTTLASTEYDRRQNERGPLDS